MSLFKKKIDSRQFIADAVSGSISMYDSNFDKLIPLADEFHVLTESDRAELKEFGYALIIADLMTSCQINFGGKISNKKIGEEIGFIYVQFLGEVKHLGEVEIEKKTNAIQKLLTAVEANEDKEIYKKAGNPEDNFRLLICSIFAQLYSGDNLAAKRVEGKRFAAFKLAKGIVKADIIGIMLKEFKVDWK